MNCTVRSSEYSYLTQSRVGDPTFVLNIILKLDPISEDRLFSFGAVFLYCRRCFSRGLPGKQKIGGLEVSLHAFDRSQGSYGTSVHSAIICNSIIHSFVVYPRTGQRLLFAILQTERQLSRNPRSGLSHNTWTAANCPEKLSTILPREPHKRLYPTSLQLRLSWHAPEVVLHQDVNETHHSMAKKDDIQ